MAPGPPGAEHAGITNESDSVGNPAAIIARPDLGTRLHRPCPRSANKPPMRGQVHRPRAQAIESEPTAPGSSLHRSAPITRGSSVGEVRPSCPRARRGDEARRAGSRGVAARLSGVRGAPRGARAGYIQGRHWSSSSRKERRFKASSIRATDGPAFARAASARKWSESRLAGREPSRYQEGIYLASNQSALAMTTASSRACPRPSPAG